jgi:hypothetical protein
VGKYRVESREKGKGMRIGIVGFTLAILLLPHLIHAGDVNINGFLQGNYTPAVSGSNPDGGDFKWVEERFQLKLNASRELFSLFLKTDFFYDHIAEKTDIELREGYIDYFSDYWDMRIGRQVITWGLGDLIFINDVFPKDYEAFFSGRPIEYLKKGIDGVKIGLYPEFVSVDLVIIPFFESNVYPESRRFSVFDPMPSVTVRHEFEPATRIENTELALRFYRDVYGYETVLYFYRGFFRQNALFPDSITAPSEIRLLYPELTVYGISVQGRSLGGILSMEVGFYDSRQDRDGKNPMIPNSSTQLLLGYQRQVWEDFTAGFQYFINYMHDYLEYMDNLPQGFPAAKKLQDLLTVRLTNFLMHQTLRLSFFSFWSLSDGDYLLIPEIKYKFTDNIWAAAGANIFGGGEVWNQFGQFSNDDNIYVQVRYEF